MYIDWDQALIYLNEREKRVVVVVVAAAVTVAAAAAAAVAAAVVVVVVCCSCVLLFFLGLYSKARAEFGEIFGRVHPSRPTAF